MATPESVDPHLVLESVEVLDYILKWHDGPVDPAHCFDDILGGIVLPEKADDPISFRESCSIEEVAHCAGAIAIRLGIIATVRSRQWSGSSMTSAVHTMSPESPQPTSIHDDFEFPPWGCSYSCGPSLQFPVTAPGVFGLCSSRSTSSRHRVKGSHTTRSNGVPGRSPVSARQFQPEAAHSFA